MTSDETPGSSERKRSRAKNGVCFESGRTDETRRVRLANDVDLPLEEFITVGESDGYEYTDALPAYELPGSGERLASCGDDVPALFCPICGTPETVGRTCRRSSCPRCWQSWVYQRARTLAAKVESLGRHEYAQNDRAVKQHHLVVSSGIQRVSGRPIHTSRQPRSRNSSFSESMSRRGIWCIIRIGLPRLIAVTSKDTRPETAP